MDKRTVLLLGVGQDQLPMIKEALDMGLRVIGFDGNPEAPGFKFCDHYEMIDIRDPDLVEEKALYWNKKVGVDGVISPAVEVGQSVGRVVDRLGLSGIGEITARKLTNKRVRHMLFDELKIPQPKWARRSDAADWTIFPAVIKPENKSAAVGVKLIETREALLKEKEYDVINEYIEGGWEISTECLIRHRVPYFCHADRNYDKKEKYYPYLLEDGCQYPSKISKRITDKIETITKKIARELNVTNGALKLDVIVKDNLVYILECAPRLGGGKLSSTMIPLVDSFSYWKVALSIAMGMEIELNLTGIESKFVAQRYVFNDNPTSHRDRPKDFICTGDTYEEAVAKAEHKVSTYNNKKL